MLTEKQMACRIKELELQCELLRTKVKSLSALAESYRILLEAESETFFKTRSQKNLRTYDGKLKSTSTEQTVFSENQDGQKFSQSQSHRNPVL